MVFAKPSDFSERLLDNAMLKDIASKNVWSAPALQGLSFCRQKQQTRTFLSSGGD
jgi:hypothetical protein